MPGGGIEVAQRTIWEHLMQDVFYLVLGAGFLLLMAGSIRLLERL